MFTSGKKEESTTSSMVLRTSKKVRYRSFLPVNNYENSVLQFASGQNADSLGLDGSEDYVLPLAKDLDAGGKAKISAVKANGTKIEFEVLVRLDTPWEKMCLLTGGILPFVAKKVLG